MPDLPDDENEGGGRDGGSEHFCSAGVHPRPLSQIWMLPGGLLDSPPGLASDCLEATAAARQPGPCGDLETVPGLVVLLRASARLRLILCFCWKRLRRWFLCRFLRISGFEGL